MGTIGGSKTSLTREQKEAVGLLSIGTFLEYFDLMLYVHMAVLLNDLFFPKTDPFIAQLLAAFAFCSSYLFRPLGALIFGWIGDNIGRKHTVVITTTMMAVCCVMIFALPTYAEIGIWSSIGITICRVLQGMSSMGEIVGAEIYLTELVKPPLQYPTVASLGIWTNAGSVMALLIASVFSIFNWRYAFLLGAIIAVVGLFARTKLRETRDFLDAQLLVNKTLDIASDVDASSKNKVLSSLKRYQDKQTLNFKTLIAHWGLMSAWPAWFYFIFIYSSGLMKNLGASNDFIIQSNFKLALVALGNAFLMTYLVKLFHPLKILKFKTIGFSIFCLFFYAAFDFDTITTVRVFQLIFSLLCPCMWPAVPIVIKYLPVLRRFTVASLINACARIVVLLLTSFGLIWITKLLGNKMGNLLLIATITIYFYFSTLYYINLEKASM